MKKVETILIQCIDDIKAGRVSVKDCLDRYPDMLHELEPLLKVALSVKAPSDIHPSDAFKARARVNLMEYIYSSQSEQKTARSPSQVNVRPGWYSGWSRAVAIVVAVVLVVSAAGTGTVFASQSSLPGDTVYSIKLGTEQLQRIIIFDDAAEAELELKFASIRLDELEKLANMPPTLTAMTKGSYGKLFTMSIISLDHYVPEKTYITQAERIATAVAGYERNLNLAITKSEQVINNAELLETIALAIHNHFERLDDIEDGASKNTREAILNFKEVAINGQISALQNLAKINPVKAKGINLRTIQGRLDRAETEAVKGNIKSAADALWDYEKLLGFEKNIPNSTKGASQDSEITDQPKGTGPAGQQGPSDHSQAYQKLKDTIEQSNNQQNNKDEQKQDNPNNKDEQKQDNPNNKDEQKQDNPNNKDEQKQDNPNNKDEQKQDNPNNKDEQKQDNPNIIPIETTVPE
ncbi:hypothetical protein ACFLT6_00035 [Chloroflexota bacterium]